MNWAVIRKHYEDCLNATGLSQEHVAAQGGLSPTPGQTAISKLLHNDRLGPSVDTFVRAVLGLGITCSQFFTALEQGLDSTLPPEERTQGINVLQVAIGRHGPPRRPRKRPRTRRGLKRESQTPHAETRPAAPPEPLPPALTPTLQELVRQEVARALAARAPERE